MNGKFQSTAVFTPRTGGVKGTQCPCAGAPAGIILDLAHALRGECFAEWPPHVYTSADETASFT